MKNDGITYKQQKVKYPIQNGSNNYAQTRIFRF